MSVSPVGPPDAEIVCVGRDPGFHEMATGRPFVGPAGKLLDRALAAARLDRATVLITNVVPTRPLGDRWEAHSADEIIMGTAQLHSLLGAYERKLIVALGEQAVLACLGHDPMQKLEHVLPDSISNIRGYVFEGPWGPVLAMVHPAFILRTWHPWWPTFCWDWKKAARLETHPARGERSQAWASQPHIVDAWLAKCHGPLAVDIEQTGDDQIACVGFSYSDDFGLTLPYTTQYHGLIQFLLASEMPKIFHNGQYDVTMLTRDGLAVNAWEHDTMLLWHAVEPMLAGKIEEKKGRRTEKSLRFLVSLLTDEPFYKNYDFETETDKFLLCAKDARVTLEIFHKLQARLT